MNPSEQAHKEWKAACARIESLLLGMAMKAQTRVAHEPESSRSLVSRWMHAFTSETFAQASLTTVDPFATLTDTGSSARTIEVACAVRLIGSIMSSDLAVALLRVFVGGLVDETIHRLPARQDAPRFSAEDVATFNHEVWTEVTAELARLVLFADEQTKQYRHEADIPLWGPDKSGRWLYIAEVFERQADGATGPYLGFFTHDMSFTPLPKKIVHVRLSEPTRLEHEGQQQAIFRLQLMQPFEVKVRAKDTAYLPHDPEKRGDWETRMRLCSKPI